MTEKDPKLLQELKNGGVKFLPWIGDKYEDGIYYDETGKLCYGNGKGKKVLVLGESFYWGEEDDDDDGNGNNSSDASSFVANLIDQVISGNPEFNIRTFKRFENAMAYGNMNHGNMNHEKKWDLSDRAEFWNHLIFYDYVQEPLTYPRFSPTPKQFEEAEKPFWTVIDVYKPDIIISWGMRLYNNLPPKGEIGEYIKYNGNSFETWIYNDHIRVIPIIHPAAPMFSTEMWYNVIKQM